MKSEIKSYDNGSFAALGLMGNETQSPSVARRRLVFFLPEAGKQSGGGLTDGWTAVGCFTRPPLRPPPSPPLWRSCRGTCEGRSAQISAGGPSRSFWLLAHDRLQEGRGVVVVLVGGGSSLWLLRVKGAVGKTLSQHHSGASLLLQ